MTRVSATPASTSAAEVADSPVLIRRNGRLGHVTLNRPRAINALTHEMVVIIADALEEWRDDPEVHTILLTGSGERGLCAGGDIVSIYRDGLAGGSASADFWRDEYHLNASIADYPKPVVALMDGIVLGGGIGLAAHSSHRVVTERSRIGMPETGIGFLPDVGGTWLLSHAPGELGTHLALTAGSVTAGDAIVLGLADAHVPGDKTPELVRRLAIEDPQTVIDALRTPAPKSPLQERRAWIDDCYAGEDLSVITANLQNSPHADAREAAESLLGNSPTSLAVTLMALRKAGSMPDLRHALDQEYRLSLRFHGSHDFLEGVRAQVVEKDRNPEWEPATVEAIDEAMVSAYFATLGERELGLAPVQEVSA